MTAKTTFTYFIVIFRHTSSNSIKYSFSQLLLDYCHIYLRNTLSSVNLTILIKTYALQSSLCLHALGVENINDVVGNTFKYFIAN